jgi:hypothetical protein
MATAPKCTPYIMFCKSNADIVKREFPGLAAMDYLGMLGKRFKTLKPNELEPFIKLSDQTGYRGAYEIDREFLATLEAVSATWWKLTIVQLREAGINI